MAGDMIDSWTGFIPCTPTTPCGTSATGTNIEFGWIDERLKEFTTYTVWTPSSNLYADEAEWSVEDVSSPYSVSYNCTTFSDPLYVVDTAQGRPTFIPLQSIPEKYLQQYVMGGNSIGYLVPSHASKTTGSFTVFQPTNYNCPAPQPPYPPTNTPLATPTNTPTSTSTNTATSTPTPSSTSTAASPTPTLTSGPGVTINSVIFGGSVDAPHITINGTGFGSAPTPVPAGCGGSGYDYTTGSFSPLFITDNTTHPGPWEAGSPPSCIGLVNLAYSDTQVSYGLGNGYSCCRNSYNLSAGDPFQVAVSGIRCSGTVDYTAPVPCATFTPIPTIGSPTSTPTSSSIPVTVAPTPTSMPVVPGQSIIITWPDLGQMYESAYWDQPDGVAYNELPGNGTVGNNRCTNLVTNSSPLSAQCFIPTDASAGLHTISLDEYPDSSGTVSLGGQLFTVQVSGSAATPLPSNTPANTDTPSATNTATATPTNSPTEIPWTSQTSGTTNSLHAITCTSAMTCETVGISGTLLGTANGGTLWNVQHRPGGTQAVAKCKVDDHFAPSVADQGGHRAGFAQCRPFCAGEWREMDVPRCSMTAKMAEVPCASQKAALFLAQTECYFALGCSLRNTGPSPASR